MQICYTIFAGISLRLCSISLRSFRITFAVYLPTHIKSLRDFFQFITKYLQGQLVYHFRFFLFLIPPTIRQQFNHCPSNFPLSLDMPGTFQRLVGNYAPFWCRNHCSLLLPLCVRNLLRWNHKRPSPRLGVGCGALSPSCARSLLRSFIRLHGVSHDTASPMPVLGVSGVSGVSGVLKKLAGVEVGGLVGIILTSNF